MKRQQLSATDESKTQAPQVNSLQQVITRHSSFLSSAPHTRSPHTRSAAEARGGRDGTVVGEGAGCVGEGAGWRRAKLCLLLAGRSSHGSRRHSAGARRPLRCRRHSPSPQLRPPPRSPLTHGSLSARASSTKHSRLAPQSSSRAALPRTAVLVSRRSPHMCMWRPCAREEGSRRRANPVPYPGPGCGPGRQGEEPVEWHPEEPLKEAEDRAGPGARGRRRHGPRAARGAHPFIPLFRSPHSK